MSATRRSNRLLSMVGLIDFADHRPHQLSGGMRQRCALARALAQDSELLLMDEPFAALDAITRDQLHDDLNRIWQETGKTIIFVTHNVREAVRLGDRVVLMTPRPGRVAQTWDVEIQRPRELDSFEVSGLAHEITARLRAGANEQCNAIGSSGSSEPSGRERSPSAFSWPSGSCWSSSASHSPAGFALPGPGDTWSEIVYLTRTGVLLPALLATLERAAIGYAVALVFGTIVGLAVARVPILRAGVGSLLAGLQAFRRWSGFRSRSSFSRWMATSSSRCTSWCSWALSRPSRWASCTRTTTSLRSPSAWRVRWAHRGPKYYRHFIFSASLPAYVAGMKQAWAFSWRSLMAAELIIGSVASGGLGPILDDGRNLLDYPECLPPWSSSWSSGSPSTTSSSRRWSVGSCAAAAWFPPA